MTDVSELDVEKLFDRLNREARSSGYFLNPDAAFVRDLIRGLLTNQQRFSYQACPCRLASGEKKDDLDIICPCDYRDQDLVEHGACYCALYVSEAVFKGERKLGSIPDRRPGPDERERMVEKASEAAGMGLTVPKLSVPVWRCKVCGYLCARDDPPEICPICKAKKERFERFM